MCVAPFGWVEYRVRRGDSLFSIARATGSTIDALQAANCLDDIHRIQVGEPLYVPGAASDPVQPGGLDPQGCTDAGSMIISPLPGERVQDVFLLTGTALVDNFSHYQVEVRPDSIAAYRFYSRSGQAVVNNTLGTVDSTIFESGLYWVRLSVINTSGRVSEPACAIPLIFE